MQSFGVVLPILSLVALGYILRRYSVIKPGWIQVLNSYVYFVALPALIINSQLSLDIFNSHVISLIGWNWLAIIVASAISFCIVRLLPAGAGLKQAMYLASTVGNSVYLGIPLVTSAFGIKAGSPDYATLVLVGVMQLMAAISCALVGIELLSPKRFSPARIVKSIVGNPLLLSVVIGILGSLLPKNNLLEQTVYVPLAMLAATASPVALVTLGAFMRAHHPPQKLWALGYVVGFKLLVVAGITWLLFSSQGLGMNERASILYASMPVAVTAFVLSKKYQLDSAFVATSMLVTTAVSAITITLLITAIR